MSNHRSRCGHDICALEHAICRAACLAGRFRTHTALTIDFKARGGYEQVAGLIDAGLVRPLVGCVMGLEGAAEAQRKLEAGSGSQGKFVLKVTTCLQTCLLNCMTWALRQLLAAWHRQPDASLLPCMLHAASCTQLTRDPWHASCMQVWDARAPE
jgi:hypothetical protein